MASFLALIVFLAGLVTPAQVASVELPVFFRDLASESLDSRRPLIADEFEMLCFEHGLDSTSEENLITVHEVLFFHDLLTTTAAFDCATGGLLDIPYFFNWINPNPRHEILFLPDSVALAAVPPPAAYQQYETMADIDRVPALYLGDLVTDQPKYAHPDCGQFYTFGWCLEREMAYTALMRLLGYEGKIVQSENHACSVLWCLFRGVAGEEKVLAATIDNTFDLVRWESVPEGTHLSAWIADIGEGTENRWHNEQTRAAKQLDALRTLEVSDVAAARIRDQVVRASR